MFRLTSSFSFPASQPFPIPQEKVFGDILGRFRPIVRSFVAVPTNDIVGFPIGLDMPHDAINCVLYRRPLSVARIRYGRNFCGSRFRVRLMTSLTGPFIDFVNSVRDLHRCAGGHAGIFD